MNAVVSFVMLLLTLVVGTLAYPRYDPPEPLPPENEEGEVVQAATVTKDDTVTTIEKDLEKQLRLPRGRQIPQKTLESPQQGYFQSLLDDFYTGRSNVEDNINQGHIKGGL